MQKPEPCWAGAKPGMQCNWPHYWTVQQSWFAWVNAAGNLSHKLPFPGPFLSKHWFMLCITLEVEPRTVEQYNCNCCCVWKNYRGNEMEDRKKSLHHFLADEKTVSAWKKMYFLAWATSSCLLPDALWLKAFKNVLKVDCELDKFTVIAFHCEESMHHK